MVAARSDAAFILWLTQVSCLQPLRKVVCLVQPPLAQSASEVLRLAA